MNWKVPQGDTKTVPAIEMEWRAKHKAVLNLCKNKNTVIQAGGNLGIFPVYLSKYFDQVITFEPVNKNLGCLLTNIGHVQNITVFDSGLGNTLGNVQIQKEIPQNCGAIRLEYTDNGDMKVMTLDSHKYNNVDLIWYDIEGFEVKALLGSIETIERCKPVIVLENNGICPEFPGDLEGSWDMRKWVEDTFDYVFCKRIMRDDIYVPA